MAAADIVVGYIECCVGKLLTGKEGEGTGLCF